MKVKLISIKSIIDVIKTMYDQTINYCIMTWNFIQLGYTYIPGSSIGSSRLSIWNSNKSPLRNGLRTLVQFAAVSRGLEDRNLRNSPPLLEWTTYSSVLHPTEPVDLVPLVWVEKMSQF